MWEERELFIQAGSIIVYSLSQQAHPDELELDTPIWIESDMSGILTNGIQEHYQDGILLPHTIELHSHISLALLSKRTLARRLEGLLNIDSFLR